MQVGAGGVAGRAFEADRLALRDDLTGLHQRTLKMPVERQQAGAVTENDIVSVASLVGTTNGHQTVVGGEHWGQRGGRQVKPGMEVGIGAVTRFEDEVARPER